MGHAQSEQQTSFLRWLWPSPGGQKPLTVTNENENQLGYGFLSRGEGFVFAVKAPRGNPVLLCLCGEGQNSIKGGIRGGGVLCLGLG